MIGPLHRALTALVYAFLIGPIVFVILVSFSAGSFISFPPPGWSGRWYAALWDNEGLFAALRASVLIAAVVSALALSLSLPAAYAIARLKFPGREAMFGFFTAPLLLPTLVLGLALLLAFTPWRLIATYPGLILAHLTVTIPFAMRILTTAFATLPSDVEDVAATLGASPLAVFRRVTLPLMIPGLIAAFALCFLISFDEVVISLFVVGPRLETLPTAVFHYVERRTDPLIAALSVILLFGTAAIVLLVERLVGVVRAVGR